MPKQRTANPPQKPERKQTLEPTISGVEVQGFPEAMKGQIEALIAGLSQQEQGPSLDDVKARRHQQFEELWWRLPWVQERLRQRVTELLRERGIEAPVEVKFSGTTAIIRVIQPPELAETREAAIAQRKVVMPEDGKSFIQDGVRFFPLSSAAPVVQAPPSTILHWIKKETKFEGRPLDSYHFAPANRYYLSEESIGRAANRFIQWPSQKPVGPVTLGNTDDENGYIRLQEAAQTIRVDHHTMWRWATRGTAPTDQPLDVIKCPATDQFYIREADVSKLKKLVPRSGLRAGRRQGANPQPH